MKTIIRFIVSISIVLSCVATGSLAATKNVLMIYPSDQVEDTEYTTTKTALENAGFVVSTANTTGSEAKGMHGGTFAPDLKVSNAIESDYDLLVTVGGNGIFGDLHNSDYIALVADFVAARKLTAGLCGSTAIMAKSGVFDGLKATTFPYGPLIDILEANGANYVNETVVVSGNVITGNGPGASSEFAKAVVEAALKL